MTTLYELLGALPDDDAESIRAAFRRAVKANHPDRNPGDPDAPRRFRRIVRAHAILGDENERASYDQLLDIALRQQGLKPRRRIWSGRARRAALDAITGAIFSFGLFGAGYLLLVPAPQVRLIPPAEVEMSKPEAAPNTPGSSVEPSHTVAGAGSSDKPDEVAAPKAQPEPERAEVTTPGTNAPKDAAMPAPGPEIMPDTNDPKFYQERGISAYRSGDLFLALADFDLAISLDPEASEAYINRAIVYHRMGDLKRAFADVSHAKRIDDANRRKARRATANAP